MFTVNTYIVVFQLSLNNFLENLKTQETVVFDEITLNEGNAYNKLKPLEYSQHRLMDSIHLH